MRLNITLPEHLTASLYNNQPRHLQPAKTSPSDTPGIGGKTRQPSSSPRAEPKPITPEPNTHPATHNRQTHRWTSKEHQARSNTDPKSKLINPSRNPTNASKNPPTRY